tara:strand:- start:35 stop:550 length:516 start_codon:yes stop_codon:yes gene_type:complete
MYRTNANEASPSTQRTFFLLLALASTFLFACASENEAKGCQNTIREPRAADYLLHVLVDTPTEYLSDPPTSGPHKVWIAPRFITRQLSPSEQLGILERGDVLVQYKPSAVTDSQISTWKTTVSERAHLAPNSDLPSDFVMTAHLTKQICTDLTTAAINRFVEANVDSGQKN